MGTIIEKLNHLKETIQYIQTALNIYGIDNESHISFRKYTEKIHEAIERRKKILNAILGLSYLDYDIPKNNDGHYVHTVRGIEAIYDSTTINIGGLCIFPSGMTEEDCEYIAKSTLVVKNSNGNNAKQKMIYDFSNDYSGYHLYNSIIDIPNLNTTIMPSEASFVAFPENMNFPMNGGGYILANVYKPTTLQYGLSFGKKVISMGNRLCYNSYLYCGEKPVYVLPEFEGTIYLSKVLMSVETMVNIFNNLKDMTGTGTTYILNIGTTNYDRLTIEQIEIATKKGWEVV